ncbi:hypothetical protein TrRE_jg12061 [Triparma retinervis]|uniref:Uncharacterized protein n=1 Tax=Triparma retinervis TaxID=2557542 RepID=A0A9W7DXJ3_9STRA|nr:hypothetical protein TrRE_jg12061 [Triparma retinervis]
MASETEGFQVMEMKEFLEHEGGRLMPWGEDGPEGSTPTELPGGITDWSEVHKKKPLENYLRTVGLHRKFDTIKSMIIIPKDLDKSSPSDLAYLTDTMKEPVDWKTASKKYYDAPVSTRASALERFGEFSAGRSSHHVYDDAMHAAKVIHFAAGDGHRMLTHFYSMLFFEDAGMDRWVKRFVRDHVRYVDEMYCVAAKIVGKIRVRSERNGDGGEFDSMHVRRGDFQYKVTRIGGDEMYSKTKEHLKEGGTVYVATDERDKSYFNAMKEGGKYELIFLDDFMDDEDVKTLNPNFYGMLDQLIATRGR